MAIILWGLCLHGDRWKGQKKLHKIEMEVVLIMTLVLKGNLAGSFLSLFFLGDLADCVFEGWGGCRLCNVEAINHSQVMLTCGARKPSLWIFFTIYKNRNNRRRHRHHCAVCAHQDDEWFAPKRKFWFPCFTTFSSCPTFNKQTL